MKIFISWSGNKSKDVATFLKSWIEQIIQAAEPWISVDIDKGKKWNGEIINELTESRVGIICLTRDNLNSPWILFEAGALSKASDSYVCTFLIDINPTDLTGPLSIFQATRFNKEDIFKLLTSINNNIKSSGGKSLTIENLKSLFKVFYPQLEDGINKIISNSEEDTKELIRTDRELLEEAVQLLRKSKAPPKNNLETEAKSLLSFYAKKYAEAKSLKDEYQVGIPEYIDEFMIYVQENPLLLKVFKNIDGIRMYVQRQFDGLPF
ncbi:TIR domain-containing protein [Tenacibaculum finnmarkense]|uniref:TIR domain-containing protein n=1 Tax=Tenacibaculum finnmarkense TaxID=2781243 RepID=UPI001E28E7F0|nr:TIR domain-containing protein [Tenacibaculum finnmarkense]MCD8401476.1 toll/interleukin-1 receptor domain-containing protein [Tenacibaculum finnmarkense genomovar ulcerans]